MSLINFLLGEKPKWVKKLSKKLKNSSIILKTSCPFSGYANLYKTKKGKYIVTGTLQNTEKSFVEKDAEEITKILLANIYYILYKSTNYKIMDFKVCKDKEQICIITKTGVIILIDFKREEIEKLPKIKDFLDKITSAEEVAIEIPSEYT